MFDRVIEMLMNKTLSLSKVLSKTDMARVTKSTVFSAATFYQNAGFDSLLQQLKELFSKSRYMMRTSPKSPISQSVVDTLAKLSTVFADCEKPEEERFATVLFVCIQELVHQIFLGEKKRGSLLLKAISEFVKLSESKWRQIADTQSFAIHGMEKEMGQIFRTADLKEEEIALVLKETAPTEEALEKHKGVIRRLVGKLAEERQARKGADSEAQRLRKELDKWVLQYDLLSQSCEVQQRLEQHAYSQVKDLFLIPKKYPRHGGIHAA